jgi:glucose/arabinose dehydrogenase
MRAAGGIRRLALLGAIAALGSSLAAATAASAAQVPSGFQDSVVFDGLREPTAFRFSPDDRVFVAEKRGRIVVFEDLEDDSPTEFADLREQVYDYGDRGLLGLALDPDFPATPYVYALYTFDHVLDEDAPGAYPRWGEPPTYEGDSACAGLAPAVDACAVSGRLVRFEAEGDHAEGGAATPVEDVLIEDWCQQGSSHSIGDLEFGPEGALFASGGEGAIFTTADYGQFGWPNVNQCADPPGVRGEALEPPDAEGGSLRSQDVLTPADPTGLSGTVIRVHPQTGLALPGNPFYAAGPDENARRIVAFGLRNPYRFAIHPETGEIYVNNVGGGPYEEIDRFASIPSPAYNSGWPCYESDAPNEVFEVLELDLCEGLYQQPGSTSSPFFFYDHHFGVTPEDECPHEDGSAISGSAIYEGDALPASYNGALFFSDAVRGCMYVMFAGEDGRPDPSTVVPFLTETGKFEYPAVDIQVGPEGALYYSTLFSRSVEFGPGTIRRIAYFSGNQPPVAVLTATPEWGETSPGALEADFDAGDSTDADGEALTYEWDLDEDGQYDDGTGPQQTETFFDSQNHTVAVRVTDEQGANGVERVTVYPGDSPPQPEILEPDAGLEWRVGQPIDFSGEAADPDQPGGLAATSLDWSTRLYHCPGGPDSCHTHSGPAFPSVGSGTLVAPEHGYPTHLELKLTATDSRGLTATTSVMLEPIPAELEIGSDPPGVNLGVGFVNKTAPFAFTAIEGSSVTLAAPENAEVGGRKYAWQGWSDGGARVHTVLADGQTAKYTAAYALVAGPTEETTPPGSSPPPAGGGKGIGPPQTLLRKRPRAVTHKRRARFVFAASDPTARFECRLDGAAWRVCRSPRVYRRLEPGFHSFQVVARGADGQYDPTSITLRWRILR